jgi:Tfp pilus assembly protein PilE
MRFKFKTSLLDVIGLVLILGIIVAVALPGYADYSPRAKVSAALVVVGNGKALLESSCVAGTFAAMQTPAELGLPESDTSAYILRVELVRSAPDAIHVKAALTDIYGRPFFGLFPWKVIPQGSLLDFEYKCSAERKFSFRFAASTVDQKYLPASLRDHSE